MDHESPGGVRLKTYWMEGMFTLLMKTKQHVMNKCEILCVKVSHLFPWRKQEMSKATTANEISDTTGRVACLLSHSQLNKSIN